MAISLKKITLSIKEIEILDKNLTLRKTSGPDNFMGKFYQTLIEEIIKILHKDSKNLRKFFPSIRFLRTGSLSGSQL